MRLGRPPKAASVYGKAEARFIRGGWPEAGAEPANDGSGELRIFLPKNRIVCQVQNSLDLGRCSAMKTRYLLNYIVKSGNAAKRGRPEAKNLESIKGRLENL